MLADSLRPSQLQQRTCAQQADFVRLLHALYHVLPDLSVIPVGHRQLPSVRLVLLDTTVSSKPFLFTKTFVHQGIFAQSERLTGCSILAQLGNSMIAWDLSPRMRANCVQVVIFVQKEALQWVQCVLLVMFVPWAQHFQ